MKIALSGTLAGRGGIQTHLFWLARAMIEAGHELLIFSLGATPTQNDLERVQSLEKAGAVTVRFPYDGPDECRRTGLAAGFVIRRSLREFRPDVYLACGTGWNLFLPAMFSGGCRRQVFHEVMSGVSTDWRDSRWLVRYGFHQVVAQATPVADNFKRTFRWPTSVSVLPAFPEPLEVTAKLPEAANRVVPLGKARAALFSRLVPHKQALWLVRQWPLLTEHLAELHIFGTGPEEANIKDLIAKQRWSDRVYCHGPYPDGQTYVDLLSSFDLTLLPTVGAEGAPLVLLESMACGIPFVSTDPGGISDYANPDCLIVSHQEPGDFTDAVRRICKMLANGEVDRARLQFAYLSRFSFAVLAQKWNDLVSETSHH